MEDISESYENSSKLESFLWKAKFKVDRIHDNIYKKKDESFFSIISDKLIKIYDYASISNEEVFNKKIAVFVYVRCQGIVPTNHNDIELMDSNGYKFPLERFVKQFALLRNCATYIYLEVPRSNPRNLPMAMLPKIPDIDLNQAEGLLLIEYAFNTGQGWDYD